MQQARPPVGLGAAGAQPRATLRTGLALGLVTHRPSVSLRPGVRMRLALALALALAPAPAGAQAASPVLPPSHWALAALARLDALGLVGPGYDAGAGSVSRAEAARRLALAADAAQGTGFERLATSYRTRFNEEFPSDSARRSAIRVLPGSVQGGYAGSRGALLTRYDRDALHVDPAAVAPRQDPFGTGDFAVGVGTRAALDASARAENGSPGLDVAYAELALGAARLWAGRRPLGFGAAAGGNSVLTAGPSFDGLGAFTGPFRLGAFGPVRVEALASRLRATGGVADPWFAALRIWAQPHPRLWLAGNRAVAFGGHGNTPLSWGDIPGILIGSPGGAHGETENQVASVEVRWRVPAGALPLVAYGEWAIDDVGFEFIRKPGLVEGLEVPALPGIPAVALGLEHTGFPDHCCGYPPWYRHSALPWIEQRIPLGHPLGGAGSEWLLYSSLALLDARLRLDARALRRDRLADNLYSPTRQGVSNGAELDVSWTPAVRVELVAGASIEQGAGWRESASTAGVRVRY